MDKNLKTTTHRRGLLALLLAAALMLAMFAGCQAPAKAEDAPAEEQEAAEEEAPAEETEETAEEAEETEEAAEEVPEEVPEGELPRLDDAELLENIDFQCSMFFEVKELTGMSVAVLSDGKVAYLNYGVVEEGGDPVDENTIYEIASMTKTFTGTLFGYNLNNGNLQKDALVQDYYDCKVPDYRGEPMTLLQLANHTSGLPRVPTNFPDSMNPYYDYTEEMLVEYLEKGLLRHMPGESYEYSNLGIGMLGQIIGKVNNMGFEDYLKQTLLEPLDMSSSAIWLDEEQQSRKASAHLEGGAPAKEWDFSTVMEACGGLKSTTRDIARYLAANLNHIEMDVALAEAMATAHRVTFSGNAQLGLCWHCANYSGVYALAHDGLVGGYCSYNAFAPQEDIAVVILCNNADEVTSLGVDLMKTLAAAK